MIQLESMNGNYTNNKLWVFGDSYTAEYYIPKFNNTLQKNSYEKYRDWRGGTLPKIWPILLGEKLNLEVRNIAKGGSSNYCIFDQFIKVLDEINTNDILIFGWANILRYRAADTNGNYLYNIIPNGTTPFSKNTTDEILYNRSNSAWVGEVLNWIKLIDSYSGLKNIKSYHWASDGTILKGLKKDNLITVPIPFEDLCGYVNSDINYKDGISKSTIHQETNGEVKDGHHGEFGHKLMCDFIYNKFNKKII